MDSISAFSFNRISHSLVSGTMLSNVQSQQQKMFRLEDQLSTGLRYHFGSDEPFQASTAMSLQAQLERKAQMKINLEATQSYLTTSDSSLSEINNMTNEARSLALESLSTTTSATQRKAIAQTVKLSLQQMVSVGNYKFRDRYLFTGSVTDTRPFEWGEDAYSVEYMGNESDIFSWSDFDLLSQTNMNGVEVFGAISEPVRGRTDLNPALTETTLLSELNGGKGVGEGSIRIEYTDTTSGDTTGKVVDMTNCVTVEDACKKIKENAPEGAKLNIELTDHGINIALDTTTPGELAIEEIGIGMVAHELGIFTEDPSPTGVIVGEDLDPSVSLATPVEDLLGSKTRAYLRFAGKNNNLIVQGKENGGVIEYEDADGNVTDTWNMNGIDIALVAENTIPPDADAEWAEYDAATNQVLVHIHPDASTAEDIIRAINHPADPANFPPLEARLDPLDTALEEDAGQGTVPLLPNSPWVFGTTDYGSGQSLDREGLQIENGGVSHTIDFTKCETFGDLLNEINDPTVGVTAEINEDLDGIDVRTRISGTDFTIGENGGDSASQLGIRSLALETKLEELDYERGVMDYQGPGTNAEAVYQEMSADSAMILRAKQEGDPWNDYTLEFVAHSPPQDDVSVAWDQVAKTITIGINPGTTRACEVVEAFNQLPGPKEYFTLELDDTLGENSGEGVVYAGSVQTAGGDNGGTDFYITRKDGVTLAIDIEGCLTMEEVLEAINDHPDNADDRLVASLAEYGNGIELTDYSIGIEETTVRRAELSTAAIDLGLIPSGEEYETTTTVGTRAGTNVASTAPNSNLLFRALSTGTYANDVSIVFEDTVPAGNPGDTGFSWDSVNRILRFEVNDTITTADDIITLFEDNATGELKTMFEVINGTNSDGTTSDGTGVIDLTNPLDPPVMEGGEDDQLKGKDPNPREANSLFNAMIRLQQGLESGDLLEVERAVNTLDEAVDRINFARAELGVRQEGLDTINARLDDEEVNLRTALSEAHEIDLSSLVVQYTNQQISYQASLQATSKMFQLSLINFL